MKFRLFIPGAVALAVGGSLAYGDAHREIHQQPAPTDPVITAPLAPHEAVLASIQEEGRAEVRRLAERLRSETDPDRRVDLERSIREAKTGSRLRFLEALAAGAATRGETAIEAEALGQIEHLRNPAQRVFTAPNRPAPEKPAPAAGKKP